MTSLYDFNFSIPGSLIFGPGKRFELNNILGTSPLKILILTGSSWFYRLELDKEFSQILKGNQCRFCRIEKNEPTVESIAGALNEARDFSPDLMIAVGGGSVLDSAKALSGLLTNGGNVLDYLEGIGQNRPIVKPGLTWIAIPTTAGTGSEVSKNAVIKSPVHGVKKSMRSPLIMASHVIVDPELHISASSEVTAYAGLDAIVQLFESYVSKKAQPMTSALVEGCFVHSLSALLSLSLGKNTLENRTIIAYGSLISGIALANAGLGAVHGFASSIGGKFDIPHGQICALFFNPVLEHNRESIGSKLDKLLASAAGGEDPFEWLKKIFTCILSNFRLPLNLSHFSISESDIEEVANKTSGSSMSGNPCSMTLESRCKILKEVFRV
ncbi:MAG: iron-containing alcohol dehydrogenase [Spirochaetales bacterium]|nr:iron-containing alcohol dehydrogenase [Spirochaetales bacterium]